MTALGFTVERPGFLGAPEPRTSRTSTPPVRKRTASDFDSPGKRTWFPPGDLGDWNHPPFARGARRRLSLRARRRRHEGRHRLLRRRTRPAGRGGARPARLRLAAHHRRREGPSINGTDKLLRWAAERGETWDAAIVGEPTNPQALGDAVKIGRRGSILRTLTVNGIQGHAAYPHLRQPGPRHDLSARRAEAPALDEGTTRSRPPSGGHHRRCGQPGHQRHPGAGLRPPSNIRFNDLWTAETLQAEIHNRLDQCRPPVAASAAWQAPVAFDLAWKDRPSPVFLTRNDQLIETLSRAIEAETGKRPALSTSGGTSDARFIKDYCPVVEFGLVGQTMHMADERVELADLDRLTAIYRRFLETWFSDMPPAEEIQRSLSGAWQMMMGKADGLRLLDLSATASGIPSSRSSSRCRRSSSAGSRSPTTCRRRPTSPEAAFP